MRTTLIRRTLALGIGIVLLPAVERLDAQEPSRPRQVIQADGIDSRWVPWLGCWQLFEEGVRDEDASIAPDDPFDVPPRPISVRTASDLRVCVVPADSPLSVNMSTLAGGRTVLEQTIVADGTGRPITEPDCRGQQRAEWSRTGQQLFARAELSCGNQPMRTVSGITLMAPGGIWIDIQTVQIERNESVRVRRYRRSTNESTGVVLAPGLLSRAEEAARAVGATPLTLQDVIEANAKVASRAVEAALVERRARFDLNRHALITLDEAGVEDGVIDLMVALSFPDRFVVDRADRGASGSLGLMGSPFGLFDLFSYSDFAPYYYYSPFGYSAWSRYYGYGPFYLTGPGTFVVLPGGGGSGGRGTDSEGVPGRVINGLGYTRVRPREAESTAAERSGTSSGRASSTSSSGGGSSSSSGSSGGAVTPSGATSGGSGGDSGRTAVPR